jgi:hypothetical protein
MPLTELGYTLVLCLKVMSNFAFNPITYVMTNGKITHLMSPKSGRNCTSYSLYLNSLLFHSLRCVWKGLSSAVLGINPFSSHDYYYFLQHGPLSSNMRTLFSFIKMFNNGNAYLIIKASISKRQMCSGGLNNPIVDVGRKHAKIWLAKITAH